MSFTEREAIKFEMEELKVQASRDFEIYLSSRNQRNERYSQLMDRLREIDERSIRNKGAVQVVKEVDNFLRKKEESKPIVFNVNKPLPEARWGGTIQDLRVDKVRPNQEIIVKSEPEQEEVEKPKRSKKKGKYVTIEEVDPLVEKYLRFRQGEERVRDIQEYVEKELDTKWVNFSSIMARILALNPRIKKANRQGYYFYE